MLEEKRRMDVGGKCFLKAKVSRNEGGLGRGREVDGERRILLPALTKGSRTGSCEAWVCQGGVRNGT